MKLEEAHKIIKHLWKREKLNGVKFRWGRMLRGFGYYAVNKKNNKDKTIVMSKPLTLLNSKAIFINSLLHEIAHHKAGHQNGHNQIWQKVAKQIGCDGNRLYSGKIKEPKGNYIYKCPKCKHVYHLYRELKGKRSCGMCANSYDSRFVIKRIK